MDDGQAASRGQQTNGKGVLSEAVLRGSKGNKKTAFQGAWDLISVPQRGISHAARRVQETELVAPRCQVTALQPAGEPDPPALPAAHIQLLASSTWAPVWQSKFNGIVLQRQRHLFPLTGGRDPGCSLPIVKARGFHSTGVVRIAWHNTRKSTASV